MSKENKLELKHIAPYLPYGLQILRPDSNTILNVVGLNLDYVTSMEDNEEKFCGIGGIKPILRPMSDLYKNIGGKTHLIELAKKNYPHFDWCMNEKYNYCMTSTPQVRVSIEFDEGYNIFLVDGMANGVDQLKLIEYLFEHKFDVFGLIEKGLAIDKNTIE